MESTGTYQAGDTADESATPEKVVPLRRFFMPDNAYVDQLAGVIDGRTGWVLTYLLRQTIGYHRADFKCSQGQLAKALGYARNTLAAALRELDALHIVTSDAGNLSRTQVRTFHLESIESWTLPVREDETCSKFEQVVTSAEIEQDEPACSKTEQGTPSTSAEIEQEPSQTCSKFEHLINTVERNTSEVKDNDLLSDASHDAPRPIASSSSEKPSATQKPEAKVRKTFAPDSDPYRLAIHLRDGILSHKPDARVPRADAQLQQWAGVIDLMVRIDGRTPERIRNLIDAIMTNPRIAFWRGVILSPGNLRKHFDNIEIQWRERGGKPVASPSSAPVEPETDTPLARNAQATRERLARIRQEREAAEAAAKGAQS